MGTNETSSNEFEKCCPTCGLNFDLASQTCPQDGTLLLTAERCPVKEPLPRGGTFIKSLIGTVIADHYQLLEFLGEGGMSLVYKAKHLLLNRVVAIKLLKQSSRLNDLKFKRFAQEARAISALSHPNIINVLDFGLSDDGSPYMVIDYLEGKSFTELIGAAKQPDIARLLHILVQSCDALEHAHAKGILHRDFKPSNVMLVDVNGDPDFVKILDFGIAKFLPTSDQDAQRLTQTGEVFGSPLYMSPEQCLGKEIDARSDIYGVGCVMYEALSGQAPLVGDTILDTMNMQIDDIPKPFNAVCPDKHIPRALERIVLRSLEKDPNMRQQSMADLKDELSALSTELDGGLSSTPGYKPLSRPLRKRAAPLASWQSRTLACLVLLLAIAGGTQLPGLWSELNRSPADRNWREHVELAKAALARHDFDEGQREFKLALELSERFGKLDERYSSSLKGLRDFYRLSGNFKLAAMMEKELAATTKARLVAELEDTQVDLDKLADLNLSSLKSLPAMISPKDKYRYEELADTFTSLANISLDQGNLERAEQMFIAAHELDQKVFGRHSWQAALKMNDLAFFYLRQNEFQKAEPLMRQALPIMQKSLNVVAVAEQERTGFGVAELVEPSAAERRSLPNQSSRNSKKPEAPMPGESLNRKQLIARTAVPTAPISELFKDYTQVLRLMEHEVQASQMERHASRWQGTETP